VYAYWQFTAPAAEAPIEVEEEVVTTSLGTIGSPGGYSTDGTYVYYHSYGTSPAKKWVVEGADPATFSVLDSKFAKDKNFVYEDAARAFVAHTVSRDLTNGTLDLFNYALTLERDDEGNMYQYGVLAEVPDSDSFSRVSNPSDPYSDWTSYYKDKSHIYRLEGQEQILNVLNVDVDSFDIIGYGASRDLGIYEEPVFVETLYMKDRDFVYVQLPDYSGSIKIITNADPATFVLVANQEMYDAKDKNHKYLVGEIVE